MLWVAVAVGTGALVVDGFADTVLTVAGVADPAAVADDAVEEVLPRRVVAGLGELEGLARLLTGSPSSVASSLGLTLELVGTGSCCEPGSGAGKPHVAGLPNEPTASTTSAMPTKSRAVVPLDHAAARRPRKRRPEWSTKTGTGLGRRGFTRDRPFPSGPPDCTPPG